MEVRPEVVEKIQTHIRGLARKQHAAAAVQEGRDLRAEMRKLLVRRRNLEERKA